MIKGVGDFYTVKLLLCTKLNFMKQSGIELQVNKEWYKIYLANNTNNSPQLTVLADSRLIVWTDFTFSHNLCKIIYQLKLKI